MDGSSIQWSYSISSDHHLPWWKEDFVSNDVLKMNNGDVLNEIFSEVPTPWCSQPHRIPSCYWKERFNDWTVPKWVLFSYYPIRRPDSSNFQRKPTLIEKFDWLRDESNFSIKVNIFDCELLRTFWMTGLETWENCLKMNGLLVWFCDIMMNSECIWKH